MKKLDLDDPAPILDDDEDEDTLAAIDEGIRDAEAGRTVPIEEVRKLTATVDYYPLLFTHRALNDRANIVGYIADDDDEAESRSSVRRLVLAPIIGFLPDS